MYMFIKNMYETDICCINLLISCKCSHLKSNNSYIKYICLDYHTDILNYNVFTTQIWRYNKYYT